MCLYSGNRFVNNIFWKGSSLLEYCQFVHVSKNLIETSASVTKNLKARCHTRLQHAFTACCCVFKRTLKTRVATRLKFTGITTTVWTSLLSVSSSSLMRCHWCLWIRKRFERLKTFPPSSPVRWSNTFRQERRSFSRKRRSLSTRRLFCCRHCWRWRCHCRSRPECRRDLGPSACVDREGPSFWWLVRPDVWFASCPSQRR